MQNEIATINIDKKTIEGIVERQMQAAIVGQLDAVKDTLLAKMVDGLINQKVDSNGNFSNSSWEKTTLLEHLAKNKIKQMAENSINKFFEGHVESIEKAVTKEIVKQQKTIVKAAVCAIQKSMTSDFRWNVKVEVQEPK